jgi:hypothetical protein
MPGSNLREEYLAPIKPVLTIMESSAKERNSQIVCGIGKQLLAFLLARLIHCINISSNISSRTVDSRISEKSKAVYGQLALLSSLTFCL